MSILILYKPKDLGKPTEIQNHIYNASFLIIHISVHCMVYEH